MFGCALEDRVLRRRRAVRIFSGRSLMRTGNLLGGRDTRATSICRMLDWQQLKRQSLQFMLVMADSGIIQHECTSIDLP